MMRFSANVCIMLIATTVFAAPLGAHESMGVYLTEYKSLPTEELVAFLRRVGGGLHEFTSATGNEACGAIAANGSVYSVRVYTDGVPQGCTIRQTDIAEGFAWTGATIARKSTRLNYSH